MPFAIETVQLSRRFGARLALDAVSLQVPEACVYGFLGRNGAGKTTLIKLLLGLLRPDGGQVLIRGVDVARDRLAAARQTGALLEAQGFYGHLNGRENLDLSRRLLDLPAAEIDRVLDLCGMREHGPRRVADYSLGMRQRLGLARAMLGAPPVLVLDEPTNGLDPEGIADMRVFLRELPVRCGATVLLSSHLLSEIEQTASHVGILSHGRLVRQGCLAELKASVQGEVLIGTDMPERALAVAQAHGFDVSPGDGGVLARIPAGEAIAAASAALNRVLCLAGVRVHALIPRQHSLETLYREAGSAQAAALSTVPPLAA